jgi:hypothetical protein
MKSQPTSILLFFLFMSKSFVLGQQKLRKGTAQSNPDTVPPQDIPSQKAQVLPSRKLEDPSSWPECIQLTVYDCESLIGRSTKESVNFELINTSGGNVFLTMDYDWIRVRIYHDDSTPPLVIEPVPRRG